MPLFSGFVRQLEGLESPPLVIVPLSNRLRTLPWIEHPLYAHRRAAEFLSTVDSTTPLRRIRRGFPPLTPEEFARFRALRFPTWAGDLSIGDYTGPLRDGNLPEDEEMKLLYAYHHGGEVVAGRPLDQVRELGEQLRRIGAPVVVYETPVPVQKGVELWGQQFHDLADRNFTTLEDAFRSGYGDVPIVHSGLTIPTAHFIDWHDGTEHVNEHGRTTIADAVVAAANGVRTR